MVHMRNLKKYPYTRALHYFVNLDELPRYKESVSYAFNRQLLLKATFSREQRCIGHLPLGEVLNRTLIGLPLNKSGRLPVPREHTCKNIGYSYLFQIEDKKHNNDRIIYTIKCALKRGVGALQLHKLDFMRKEADLAVLFEGRSEAEVRHGLEKKLRQLQSRKYVNSMNWQFEDEVFFHHALDQQLHNAVGELAHRLTDDYLFRLLFQKEYRQYEYFHKKQPLHHYLSQMTTYYEQSVISTWN